VRTGGRGKRNFTFGGVFRKAKYEKFGEGEKARAGKNSFPPTPFLSRPARAKKLSTAPSEARGEQNQTLASGFCSKKVRAKFLLVRCEGIEPPTVGLKGHCSAY
jgi:hypothetical protein